jgi:hypothetical protein
MRVNLGFAGTAASLFWCGGYALAILEMVRFAKAVGLGQKVLPPLFYALVREVA